MFCRRCAGRGTLDRAVAELWEQFVAAAWRDYSGCGRGVLFLDMNDFLRLRDGGRLQMRFLDRAELRGVALGATDEELEVLDEALATYDQVRKSSPWDDSETGAHPQRRPARCARADAAGGRGTAAK